MRLAAGCFVALTIAAPVGAEEPGRFDDLATYDAEIEQLLLGGDMVALIRRNSDFGRASAETQASVAAEMAAGWPHAAASTELLLRDGLDGPLIREVRAFWTQDNSYGYYFALIHNRADGLRILHFGFDKSLPDALDQI